MKEKKQTLVASNDFMENFRKGLKPLSLWQKIYYPIYRFVRDIPKLPRRIWRETKWFYQRHTRGYATCDLWDLDNFLGQHTLKCLKAFRDERRSENSSFCAGAPGGLTEEQWDEILDNMIEGLEFILFAAGDRITCGIDWIDRDIKNPLTMEEYELLYPIMEKKAMLYIKHFNGLWD